MFSSWADALREQHPASFHDVLQGTAFEEGGKKYKFGVYVIKNVVSARTLREWAAGVHDLYKQKTRIKTKACTIGKDFYKSVQAVQKPCVCMYKYAATTKTTRDLWHIEEHPALNLPHAWLHDTVNNGLTASSRSKGLKPFNMMVVNSYETRKDQNIPWHNDADPLFADDQEILSLSLSGRGLFAIMPSSETEWGTDFGRTEHRRSMDRKQGLIPLMPGTILLMTGTAQKYLIHCTLKCSECTRDILEQYPETNATTTRMLDTFFAPGFGSFGVPDVQNRQDYPWRDVITFRSIACHKGPDGTRCPLQSHLDEGREMPAGVVQAASPEDVRVAKKVKTGGVKKSKTMIQVPVVHEAASSSSACAHGPIPQPGVYATETVLVQRYLFEAEHESDLPGAEPTCIDKTIGHPMLRRSPAGPKPGRAHTAPACIGHHMLQRPPVPKPRVAPHADTPRVSPSFHGNMENIDIVKRELEAQQSDALTHLTATRTALDALDDLLSTRDEPLSKDLQGKLFTLAAKHLKLRAAHVLAVHKLETTRKLEDLTKFNSQWRAFVMNPDPQTQTCEQWRWGRNTHGKGSTFRVLLRLELVQFLFRSCDADVFMRDGAIQLDYRKCEHIREGPAQHMTSAGIVPFQWDWPWGTL